MPLCQPIIGCGQFQESDITLTDHDSSQGTGGDCCLGIVCPLHFEQLEEWILWSKGGICVVLPGVTTNAFYFSYYEG